MASLNIINFPGVRLMTYKLKEMRLFFAHWPDLARRFQKAEEWLLMFDYDGTLAPIVLRPSHARLSDANRRKLRRLALRDKCAVGVLSGRSLSDLRQRV